MTDEKSIQKMKMIEMRISESCAAVGYTFLVINFPSFEREMIDSGILSERPNKCIKK